MTQFSRYLNSISRINGFSKDVPVKWYFHCGMLFLSREKWWGDFKDRPSAHEGIDITFYKAAGKSMQHFDASVQVPAFAHGQVVNICDDFLGQTLVVTFDSPANERFRTILTYAHVRPEPSVKKNDFIRKDAVIAKVCGTAKNPTLPPHLHFSCFEVPADIRFCDLDWNLFSKPSDICRIHPVFL